MNGMISLQISDEGLRRANQALHQIQSQFPQAVARAVNRTMDGLRTDAVRETSTRYFVKAKDVRASLSFRKATAGNLMGAMVSKGKRHSLADYKVTPSSPPKGRRPNVRGGVKKEGGTKLLSRAFLVKRADGRYFPYYRIGYRSDNRQRAEIRSYISPSMPQIVKNEETVRAMELGAEERFTKRLAHEVTRILGANEAMRILGALP